MTPVTLSGVTRHFEGYGRGLGYPTANILAATSLADGVYWGYAKLGRFRRRPALVFVGTPTTVGATQRRVEAHLLDLPDRDYYDRKLEVEICKFHRANVTFDSVEQLRAAMAADEAAARAWFARQ